MSKFFFVAGEDSGDARAAEVIREMKWLSPECEIHAYGGERMREAGATIHFPLTDLAAVGLGWVRNIRHYLRAGRQIFDLCRQYGIETLVLVDFPGFNLRVAARARKQGFRVVYYIIPQVWAWRRGRLKQMKRDLDLAIVVFPFEKDLLESAGIPALFSGHPLVDRFKAKRPGTEIRREAGLPQSEDIPLVGLLPGSRKSEVRRLSPILLESARILWRQNPSLHFVVPRASTIPASTIDEMFGQGIPWTPVDNPSPDLRSVFRMAITKSGTSTLENALLGVPQVVVYKGGAIEAWVARRLVEVRWLGLVNILAGKEICPEFLQENCIPSRIADASCPLLADSPPREKMLRDMEEAVSSLGAGNAARRAAQAILEKGES